MKAHFGLASVLLLFDNQSNLEAAMLSFLSSNGIMDECRHVLVLAVVAAAMTFYVTTLIRMQMWGDIFSFLRKIYVVFAARVFSAGIILETRMFALYDCIVCSIVVKTLGLTEKHRTMLIGGVILFSLAFNIFELIEMQWGDAIRGFIERVLKSGKAKVLAIGLTFDFIVQNAFDYVLYPAVIAGFGLVKGIVVMWTLSFVLSLLEIKAYDKLRQDWFGLETLKELRDYDGNNPALLLLAWATKKGELGLLIAITLYKDPVWATIYVRHGSYSGFSKRDWCNFVTSFLISNASWTIAVFTGLTLWETVLNWTTDQIQYISNISIQVLILIAIAIISSMVLKSGLAGSPKGRSLTQ